VPNSTSFYIQISFISNVGYFDTGNGSHSTIPGSPASGGIPDGFTFSYLI